MWDSFWFDLQGGYSAIVSFGIPATIMIVCYVRMFFVLNTSRKMFDSKESIGTTSEHKLRLAQMNIFKTCVIIVTVYMASFSTEQSSTFLYLIGYYHKIGTHTHIGNLFMTFNSSINPVVYAMQYDYFKIRLKAMCRKRIK